MEETTCSRGKMYTNESYDTSNAFTKTLFGFLENEMERSERLERRKEKSKLRVEKED